MASVVCPGEIGSKGIGFDPSYGLLGLWALISGASS